MHAFLQSITNPGLEDVKAATLMRWFTSTVGHETFFYGGEFCH